MKNLRDLLLTRHSIRKYTEAKLDAEDVKTIIEAGLLAPTSKNKRSWAFTVVDDKLMLEQLSKCKPLFATPIARSAMAVVVSANPAESDVWIEDASVAAAYIQLQVEALGLGSCWIQVRNRMHDDEITASEYIKELFSIDDEHQVVCVISIGYKAEERKPANPDKLCWDKVHIEKWDKSL